MRRLDWLMHWGMSPEQAQEHIGKHPTRRVEPQEVTHGDRIIEELLVLAQGEFTETDFAQTASDHRHVLTSQAASGCGGCGRKPAQPPKLNGYGPGSQLLKHYESLGVPHCRACSALAAKMDQWGPDGCEEQLEEILADMLPRARDWVAKSRPWVHTLLSGIGAEDQAIRLRLKRDVLAMIAKARKTAPPPESEQPPIHQRLERRFGFGGANHWVSAFRSGPGTPRYISNEQFARDIKSLLSLIPPDVTHVAGVSRSGLYPATMLAMLLHVPLLVIRHAAGDWIPAGNGWRLNPGLPKSPGTTLCVDDTVMTGNSLRQTKKIVKNLPGEKIFTAVYVNPAATIKPDLWAVNLPWPHLLEWNLFNSVLSPTLATDFDGILCRDCPSPDDDDKERYLQFLESASPLYLPRKSSIPLIVTARLEKYRPQTMAWLAKWGIRTGRLIMGPWTKKSDRDKQDLAAFKAEHYRRFLANQHRGPFPRLFIESHPYLAERIAQLSGGIVVCPAAGRCFP